MQTDRSPTLSPMHRQPPRGNRSILSSCYLSKQLKNEKYSPETIYQSITGFDSKSKILLWYLCPLLLNLWVRSCSLSINRSPILSSQEGDHNWRKRGHINLHSREEHTFVFFLYRIFVETSTLSLWLADVYFSADSLLLFGFRIAEGTTEVWRDDVTPRENDRQG